MSYDISLVDPVTKEVLKGEFTHYISGGTYEVGGTKEFWLNITYNYSPFFRKVFGCEEGIRSLYGKTGAETIPILRDAISKLCDNAVHDYWVPVEGNAKKALCGLLAFAKLRPDGVWQGD